MIKIKENEILNLCNKILLNNNYKEVNEYIYNLKLLISGNLEWSRICSRYHGKDFNIKKLYGNVILNENKTIIK